MFLNLVLQVFLLNQKQQVIYLIYFIFYILSFMFILIKIEYITFELWGLHNVFYDVYWIVLYDSDIKHLQIFYLMNNCAKIGVILKNWSPISPQLLLNIFLYFYGFNCKIFIAIELIFLRRKFLWNLIKIKFRI